MFTRWIWGETRVLKRERNCRIGKRYHQTEIISERFIQIVRIWDCSSDQIGRTTSKFYRGSETRGEMKFSMYHLRINCNVSVVLLRVSFVTIVLTNFNETKAKCKSNAFWVIISELLKIHFESRVCTWLFDWSHERMLIIEKSTIQIIGNRFS